MDKHPLLAKLRHDFPDLRFAAGELFSWSAKDRQVTFPAVIANEVQPVWSLLHEVGHGLLKHRSYSSDFELVRLEAAAWQQATKLAANYGLEIDPEHIQDCLDTYRDWLHQRSACPRCDTTSLQRNMTTYCCYNCNAEWQVSRARICRPYRRLKTTEPARANAV